MRQSLLGLFAATLSLLVGPAFAGGAGLSVDFSTIVTTEDRSAAVISVTLDTAPLPGENVTVTPMTNDATEGTVSGPLAFNLSNWFTPQQVTVTPGASGDGNDGNVAYTIDLNVSTDTMGGAYEGVPSPSINATNINIDGIAVIIVDPASTISVDESGALTRVVTIEAGPDVTPAADVSLSLTNNTPGSIILSAPSVTLTAGNGYSTTITISGVADDIKEATESFSITTNSSTSIDAAYNGVDPTDISGQLLDSNTVAVQVTPDATPLVVSEDGTSANVSYVLTAQPTADVNISIGSGDVGEASVSTSLLTFTNANWDTPQTVTIMGLDDPILDGTQSFSTLPAATSSTDPFWNGVDVPVVSIENQDNDSASILVNELDGVSTSESGTTDSFTVVLGVQPSDTVSIDFRSTDASEGLLSATGAAPFGTTVTLTFTPANWNTPQTITVQGQPDAEVDGTIVYTIASENIVSTAIGYSALGDADVADVSASNLDTTVAGISVNEGDGVSTSEAGSTDSFTVVLDAEPSDSVSVDFRSNDPSEGLLSATGAAPFASTVTLNFTPANWNTPQTITVQGQPDAEVDGTIVYTIVSENIVSTAVGYSALGDADVADVAASNLDTTIIGVPIPSLDLRWMVLLTVLLAAIASGRLSRS